VAKTVVHRLIDLSKSHISKYTGGNEESHALSHTILAHWFNNFGYCVYWKEYEIDFIMSLGVFCEICGIEQKIGMFYLYLHNVQNLCKG
jgi:hypothetical protein